MYRSSQRAACWIMAVGALTLAAPAIAQAQSAKPTVVTTGATKLAPTSATLLGKVTPNGAETTYLIQYGTSTLYGLATAVVNAGNGTSAVPVVANVAALAPATTYHFRLVAHNRNGTTNGADKAFRTKAQPLGIALAATPNPVPFGAPTVLGGTLSGTGNANRQVVLQSNPFPYTQGFVATTNVQLTNAAGQFAFPLLSVPINTQYKVVIPDRPEIASPIVSVGVAVRVGTSTSATRVRTGRTVRFFGTVRPARPGALFAIQLLRKGAWRTVAGGTVRGSKGGASRYVKRIRIRRGGQYRVFVAIADGNFVSAAGRTIRINRIF